MSHKLLIFNHLQEEDGFGESVNYMYPLKGMTPRVGMLGRKGIVGSSNSYPY